MRRGIGPGGDCCSREAPQPPASSSLEREEERVEFEEKNKKKCLLLLLEHRALICTRRCPRISRLKLVVVVFVTIFLVIFLLLLFLFFSHRVSLFVFTPNAQETGASVVFKLYRKNIRHSHGESGSRMGRNRIVRLPLDIKEKPPLPTSQLLSWSLRGGRQKKQHVDNYYIKMAMGVPPKVFFLDIDTGSSLTWVQSDYINGSMRLATRDLFKIKPVGAILDCRLPLCSQYQIVEEECDARSNYWCFMTVVYLDKSQFEGVVVKDMISLNFGDGSIILTSDGDEDPFLVPVVFGCSYESVGDIKVDNPSKSATDGLMGLSNSKITFSAQLKAGNVIDNNVVGICMATDDEIDDDASGYLFFGNAISTLELQWTNMNFFPTAWNGVFTLFSTVWYGEKKISCQPGDEDGALKMILDTGSDFSYFQECLYWTLEPLLKDDAIKSGYNELIPEALSPVPGGPEELPDMCWTHANEAKISEGSQGLSLDFKSLVFLFEGAEKYSEYSMHPQQYFAYPDEGTKRMCMTIFPVRESHITLGALAMKGKLFVFDYDTRQVGWETSTCKISNLLQRTTSKKRRMTKLGTI